MIRILTLLLALVAVHQMFGETIVLRVPDSGIQPQAIIGSDGTLHLIYFKGEPANGDLYYVSRASGAEAFSEPLRVNQQPESAVAMGTIRGAQLALGMNDRVHVAWMGSGKTATRPKEEGKYPQHPMLYTRLNEAGDAFEPERNVMQWTGGLDGGGSIASDSKGNVFVAWHGSAPDNTEGENGRAMFVAVSRDDGKTFALERQANPEPTGSCGCCGMRAFMDREDRLHLLYRAANNNSRDMVLLASGDQGKTFNAQTINKWYTRSCPMSSSCVADAGDGLLVVTELTGMLELHGIHKSGALPKKLGSISLAKSKHPSMAVNSRGEILVAWAEGAGWGKGGELKWRMFDDEGNPIGAEQSGGEVPTWSFPSAVVSGGSFLVLR